MDINTMLALMAASIYPAIVADDASRHESALDSDTARRSVTVAYAIWQEVLRRQHQQQEAFEQGL